MKTGMNKAQRNALKQLLKDLEAEQNALHTHIETCKTDYDRRGSQITTLKEVISKHERIVWDPDYIPTVAHRG